MASMILSGDTSGTITLSAPSVAGSNTATLPAQTGTLQMLGQGTAVASTSGTSITFTGIPSWAKRITVMFSGVGVSASSPIQIQIGSGSTATSGYQSISSYGGSAGQYQILTSGFACAWSGMSSADRLYGSMSISQLGSNVWTEQSGFFCQASGNIQSSGSGGSPALAGALDRVIITTVGGTATFTAGSINIMYEG